MNDAMKSAAGAAANERRGHWDNNPAKAAITDDFIDIGMIGEFAFARFCGLMPDLSKRRHGDGGVDFYLPLVLTVDVKTIHIGEKNLLHDSSKPMADIYVLAEYWPDKNDAILIGWTTKRRMKQSQPTDFGHGIINYHVLRGDLRAMSELDAMRGIWRKANSS